GRVGDRDGGRAGLGDRRVVVVGAGGGDGVGLAVARAAEEAAGEAAAVVATGGDGLRHRAGAQAGQGPVEVLGERVQRDRVHGGVVVHVHREGEVPARLAQAGRIRGLGDRDPARRPVGDGDGGRAGLGDRRVVIVGAGGGDGVGLAVARAAEEAAGEAAAVDATGGAGLRPRAGAQAGQVPVEVIGERFQRDRVHGGVVVHVHREGEVPARLAQAGRIRGLGDRDPGRGRVGDRDGGRAGLGDRRVVIVGAGGGDGVGLAVARAAEEAAGEAAAVVATGGDLRHRAGAQ